MRKVIDHYGPITATQYERDLWLMWLRVFIVYRDQKARVLKASHQDAASCKCIT